MLFEYIVHGNFFQHNIPHTLAHKAPVYITHPHATPSHPNNPTQSHAIPRNPMQSHAIPRNPTQSHAIPHNPRNTKLTQIDRNNKLLFHTHTLLTTPTNPTLSWKVALLFLYESNILFIHMNK
jgi:hypothetical protein